MTEAFVAPFLLLMAATVTIRSAMSERHPPDQESGPAISPGSWSSGLRPENPSSIACHQVISSSADGIRGGSGQGDGEADVVASSTRSGTLTSSTSPVHGSSRIDPEAMDPEAMLVTSGRV